MASFAPQGLGGDDVSATKTKLAPNQDRFKLDMMSKVENAYGGIGTASWLKDQGVNIPRNIELKVQEGYVSKGSYAWGIMLGMVFAMGIDVLLYAYLLEESTTFSLLGSENPMEAFAFFFTGMFLGMLLGHSESTGPKRCNPLHIRVKNESTAFNPCIDSSDCTKAVDKGEGLNLCTRGSDVGRIGAIRKIGMYTPAIIMVILFVVASQSEKGLVLNGTHRFMSMMFGCSIGIMYQMVFSKNHKVHAVSPVIGG